MSLEADLEAMATKHEAIAATLRATVAVLTDPVATAMHNGQYKFYDRVTGKPLRYHRPGPPKRRPKPFKLQRGVGRPPQRSLAQAARLVLARADGPLSRTTLWERVQRLGFKTASRNPRNILSTLLSAWKKDRIATRVGPDAWVLTDKDGHTVEGRTRRIAKPKKRAPTEAHA